MMKTNKNLDKSLLYESVKKLVETPHPHIHLTQPKIYTLFSIAFQFILFRASKVSGHYIIRIEDSHLAEKIAKKAKDDTTRKFISRLLIPRRLSYGNSTFHLDYFPMASWGITKDLPREKIQGALIVKNTSSNPLIDEEDFRHNSQHQQTTELFGEHYYLNSLLEFVPKTLTIAFDKNLTTPNHALYPIEYDFIKSSRERLPSGVMISEDISFDEESSDDEA